MGWVAPGGWRVDHDALCSLRPVKLFIVPRTLSRERPSARSRARTLVRPRSHSRPSLRRSQPSSLSLRPVLSSSIRPHPLPPPSTSDNYCSQPLSLPSIPRFFPMATSSLKAASSTSRSAGIQPSMRGRVVPSCREHAVPSCMYARCVRAPHLYLYP